MNTLNIATMPIADKVRRHMAASYYALQLNDLQVEANRLGYLFAQAETAATMPLDLAFHLAWNTEYTRIRREYPNARENWARWTADNMDNGYAKGNLRDMLAALTALGIRLQETPLALALLADEKYRLYEIFDRQNDSSEDHPA